MTEVFVVTIKDGEEFAVLGVFTTYRGAVDYIEGSVVETERGFCLIHPMEVK